MPEPRPTAERIADAQRLIADQQHAWVASATAAGEAYMIPLTYAWDGARFTFATPERSRTVRDLRRAGRTRIALPSAADVVIVDGTAEFVPSTEREAVGAAYAGATGWDPRAEPEEYAFFWIVPVRVQAWRDANELAGRVIMRDGEWVVGD